MAGQAKSGSEDSPPFAAACPRASCYSGELSFLHLNGDGDDTGGVGRGADVGGA